MKSSTGRIVVCLEHRFTEVDGNLYTELAFPYSYWKDYLVHFKEVLIVARVASGKVVKPVHARVDGPGVKFIGMPYYVGPAQFLRRLPSLIVSAARVAKNEQLFLLRSGNIANLVWPFLLMLRRPYLREYPGNVREGVEGFAGGGVVAKCFASALHWIARMQAHFSVANSFVSRYCEQIYPSRRPSYVFSSFSIDEVSSKKRNYAIGHRTSQVVSVGRLELEKGHEFLVRALSAIRKTPVELHLIGDGGQRAALASLGREENATIVFHGAVTDRQELFKIVSSCDVFVLPSLTEGMPRALLEAMAVGMPCLASKVGGVGEVLQSDATFPAGDSLRMGRMLEEVLGNESLRMAWGNRNAEFVKAHYSAEAMRREKTEFWRQIYEPTDC